MLSNKESFEFCNLPVDAPFYKEVMDLHKKAIEESESIYLDPKTGCTVFTALYHIQRGSCCGSGCRHCPYQE